MHGCHRGVAGNVEHADQHAPGIEHRRGRAVQDPVRVGVVLGAAHFHRSALGYGGADRIGADLGFAPASAGHQGHPPGLVEEPGVAFGIQDPAVGVGQDDDAAGVGRVAGEDLHLRPGQSPQVLVAFAQRAQARGIDRLDRGTCVHRQPQTQAAAPGLQDRGRHVSRRRAPALKERAPCLDYRIDGLTVLEPGHVASENVAICDRCIDACPDTHHSRDSVATTFDAALRKDSASQAGRTRHWTMPRRSSRSWHTPCVARRPGAPANPALPGVNQ